MSWVFGFAVFTTSVLLMKPEIPTEKTDAIIVLTGGKNRIEAGMTLFSEHLAPELFITGVHEHVTKEDLTKRHTGEALPACCITIGYKATTTTGNANEVAEWLHDRKFKTITLVTSNYHMPRAILEFRRAVPDVSIISYPVGQTDIAPADRYFWIVMVEEYHKTIFRFFDIIFRRPK
jgi:uncharacterized SAM-binding protein YcdF (DUF218 family)